MGHQLNQNSGKHLWAFISNLTVLEQRAAVMNNSNTLFSHVAAAAALVKAVLLLYSPKWGLKTVSSSYVLLASFSLELISNDPTAGRPWIRIFYTA